MIQNQLIEYISSQLKLGISKDVVKTSLIGAGWSATDVDETMKHLDSGGGAVAVQPTAPAMSPSPASSISKPAVAASPKMQDPQTVRMSDLISTTDTAKSFGGFSDAKVQPASPNMSMSAGAKEAKMEKSPITAPAIQAAKSQPVFASASAAAAMQSSLSMVKPEAVGKSGLIIKIIGIVLIVALAGLSGFLYFQNSSLTDKVAALNTQSAKVAADLAAIKGDANSSSTGFAAQLAELTAQNTDLLLNLSFYAVPSTPAIGPSKVLLTGTISGSAKTAFIVTTKYGAKVTVQNSKDAKVAAWLTPLVGTSTVVSGTYTPGTPVILAVPPEAPAAPQANTSSTTSSSSAAMATTTATSSAK